MLSQVLQLLHDDLVASPEALGDARKETPEELAERHERVLAGSLLAFSSLLDLLVSVEPQQAANGLCYANMHNIPHFLLYLLALIHGTKLHCIIAAGLLLHFLHRCFKYVPVHL